MSLHDAFARLTPLERLFDDASADRFFAEVEDEARERRLDLTDPHQFGMAAAVRRVTGTESGAAEGAALLFQLHHFRSHGSRVVLLRAEAARGLTEAWAGPHAGEPEAPWPAGYLQLPRHLFWIPGDDDTPPRSVDGLHWTLGEGDRLFALPVLSLGNEVGVAPLPPAPWGERASWLRGADPAAAGGYRADIPGAELEGLLSFREAGDVLTLLVRAFARIDPSEPQAPAQEPTASRYPYYVVDLEGATG